jgi:CBS domain-containing protein
MKTVCQVMSQGLLSVPPNLCATTLAQLFERHGITGAPVIDHRGAIVGVVTQADLTRARAELGAPDEDLGALEMVVLLVRDIMNPQVHSIEGDASVAQAARTMLELDVRRLLVRSDEGIVGIVTAGDLMRAWLPADGPPALVARIGRKGDPDAQAA